MTVHQSRLDDSIRREVSRQLQKAGVWKIVKKLWKRKINPNLGFELRGLPLQKVWLETPLPHRVGSSLHQSRIATYHLESLNRAIDPDQRVEHYWPLNALLPSLFGISWYNSR